MTNIASTKQLSFINTLLDERVVPEPERTGYQLMLTRSDLDSKTASGIISTLLNKPKKVRDALAARIEEEQSWFEGVENSYYAVPTSVLRLLPAFEHLRGDLAFFRVYTYKGKRYIRLLRGAPGDFNTARLGRGPMQTVLSLLQGHHVEYATLFGAHFARCGRCAAPLTDQKSRETHLGPECRRVWGIN